MAVRVVQRFAYSARVEIELRGGTVHVPAIRAHVGDELTCGLTSTFDDELATPWVRDVNQKVVRRLRSQRTRNLREGVGCNGVVCALKRHDLTGANRIGDATPKRKQRPPGLALVFRAKDLTRQREGLLIARAKLNLPTTA